MFVCVWECSFWSFCLTRTIYFKTYSFLPSFIFVFRISFIGCNKQILTLLLRALFTPSTVGSAHLFTHSPFFFAYFCFWVPSLLIEYFPMSMLLLFNPVFYFRFNIVVVDINNGCRGGTENESVRECILCWWEGANVGCFSYKFFVNHTHFLVCVRDATVNTIVHF